jgi:hypothetical protein
MTQWKFSQVLEHTKKSAKSWQYTKNKSLWEDKKDWIHWSAQIQITLVLSLLVGHVMVVSVTHFMQC